MRILVRLFFVAVMMVGCVKDGVSGEDLRVGERLPGFEVVMSDGSVVRDGDLRGKVSVVMFFHTSCADCGSVLPVMQRIYDEYASEGVVFVLIGREEGADEIRAYWGENGFEMPYSAQTGRGVYEKFAKSGIPRIYVNDRDGIVRYLFTDSPVPEYGDLRFAVESLIR